jgi:hypothetical protein
VEAVAQGATALDERGRVAMAGGRTICDLRLAGLRALHGVAPVRRAAMRLGLGG